MNTYKKIGLPLPTLERDNNIIDIDPFTVFGLFNKVSLKEKNRISIISQFIKEFNLTAPLPTSFDGIPTVNNQNATFYYFIDGRGDTDIDDLWNLFESAINYTQVDSYDNRKAVSKYFDLVINKKGNGNSKVTMGLYWIAPNAFINLDSRSEWYIYESKKLPFEITSKLPKMDKKISADIYFEILKKLKLFLNSDSTTLKDFKDLSFEAWRYSQ